MSREHSANNNMETSFLSAEAGAANNAARTIASNDTIVAVLINDRLAKSRYAGYGHHKAGVVQLHSRDGQWSSHRMVVSLRGDCGEAHYGELPVDRDQLYAALRLAEFLHLDKAVRGRNEAVATQLTHCVSGDEALALVAESRR